MKSDSGSNSLLVKVCNAPKMMVYAWDESHFFPFMLKPIEHRASFIMSYNLTRTVRSLMSLLNHLQLR